MSAFLFAFVAAFLCGMGARDQGVVAGLVQRQGPRPALLLTAVACTVAACAVALGAAQGLIPLAPSLRRTVLLIAVVLAGIELVFTRARAVPAEPTASLGALAVVLLAHQLTDSARLLMVALAAATHAPLAAGIGGAAGAAGALALGWSAPELARSRALVLARRGFGGLTLIGAAAAFALY